MENFKYRNKEVEFSEVTGEVLGQNKYSETHVSSSGGGGYVGQHGGHVSAPQVRSTAITNHEFWIKTDDGAEKSVQLSGCDIPLREGHKITLITAGLKGKKSSYHSILVNHNAKKHWFIKEAQELNKLLGLQIASGKSILIAGLIIWFVVWASLPDNGGWQNASWSLAFILGGLFLAYRIANHFYRFINLKKDLNNHLQKLAKNAYKPT